MILFMFDAPAEPLNRFDCKRGFKCDAAAQPAEPGDGSECFNPVDAHQHRRAKTRRFSEVQPASLA
jgi:hypothetical protein